MTDEEFLFHETNRERKRNSYGDFHKKRRGGKHVRLPSDNLTKKEKQKMNGDCTTYQLDVPRTMEEFRALPDEIKKEYLNHLHKKYHVSPKVVAEMLGRSYWTLHEEMIRLGISWGKGQSTSKKDLEAWKIFVGKDKPIETVTIQAKAAELIPAKTDEVDFNTIARWLKSSGAKIKIEISWGE